MHVKVLLFTVNQRHHLLFRYPRHISLHFCTPHSLGPLDSQNGFNFFVFQRLIVINIHLFDHISLSQKTPKRNLSGVLHSHQRHLHDEAMLFVFFIKNVIFLQMQGRPFIHSFMLVTPRILYYTSPPFLRNKYSLPSLCPLGSKKSSNFSISIITSIPKRCFAIITRLININIRYI